VTAGSHGRGPTAASIGGTAFRRLAYAAVVDLADDTQVVAAAPGLVAVRDLRGKRGAVVFELHGDEGDDDARAQAVAALLSRWDVGETSVLLVGPEGDARPLADRATPLHRQGRLRVGGVTADGTHSWGERDKGPLGPRLDAILDPDAPRDWSLFETRMRRSMDRAREQQGFARRLRSRRPMATYVLLAVNVAMFGLEVARGGLEPSVPLLVRLGGIAPHRVAQGEVWRLISGAFLHGGLAHLAFNMMVLFVLGGFVERLLGTARFLVLYAVCALAGGLASIAFMDAVVAVGASGALWGLLASEAVFAFAPGYLPAVLLPQARRTALINLGLNVAASTMPHVDWAAHAGGGIAGAALVTFVLSRGLPRGESLGSEDLRPSRGMTSAAALAAGLLAAGAIAGPVLGGGLFPPPAQPRFVEVRIPEAKVALDIPDDLAPGETIVADERVERTFGDPLADPVAVGVAIVPLGALPPDDDLPVPAGDLREALGEPPAHAEVIAEPAQVDGGPFPTAAAAAYEFPSGLRQDVHLALGAPGFVRVDVFYFADGAAYAEGLARHIAESVHRR